MGISKWISTKMILYSYETLCQHVKKIMTASEVLSDSFFNPTNDVSSFLAYVSSQAAIIYTAPHTLIKM